LVRQLVKDKGAEIDKVEEKNVRLQEIIDELQVQEGLTRPSHAACEQEGWQLRVEDAEIKVEKYLSAAERAEAERARAEEEERRKANEGDDQIVRALGDMMGGTLEVKRETDVGVDLDKPDFYDGEDLTEEQQKQCREYERRLQIYEEELEKHRRALETEAKKIRGEVQAVLDAFDAKLHAVADEKLVVDAEAYQYELQVTLLLDSLVKEEDLALHITRLQKRADAAQLDLQSAGTNVEAFREELDAFREVYETLLNDDRQQDKALRRELADEAGPNFDALQRLWRKRTYPAALEGSPGGDQPATLDPFSAEREAEGELPRPEPLDLPWPDGLGSIPEDLDPEVVERFEGMRERKIDMEIEVKRMANRLLQLNQRLSELLAVHEDSQAQYQMAQDELRRLQDEGESEQYDLVMLFKVKQGTVEIDMETVMDEASDGAMVEVGSINTLNTAVRALGKEKVVTMGETKDFKSKIHATNWDIECLDFKAEEVGPHRYIVRCVSCMYVCVHLYPCLDFKA